jgi:hypothetical protein
MPTAQEVGDPSADPINHGITNDEDTEMSEVNRSFNCYTVQAHLSIGIVYR